MEKYLIFKRDSALFNAYPIFKVMSDNGKFVTIAGQAKRRSGKAYCLYKIQKDKIDKSDWADLDEFLKNCKIIDKNFYRTQPVKRTYATMKIDYDDPLYTIDNGRNVLVATCDDLWVYYDKKVEQLFFLEKIYFADGNIKLCENGCGWTKQKLAQKLKNQVDKSLSEDLFDKFEF